MLKLVIRDQVEYRKYLDTKKEELIKLHKKTRNPESKESYNSMICGIEYALHGLNAWDRCTKRDKEEEQ